jgi:hypothetical protein
MASTFMELKDSLVLVLATHFRPCWCYHQQAIQDQQKLIDELKSDNNSLKAELSSLKSSNDIRMNKIEQLLNASIAKQHTASK